MMPCRLNCCQHICFLFSFISTVISKIFQLKDILILKRQNENTGLLFRLKLKKDKKSEQYAGQVKGF